MVSSASTNRVFNANQVLSRSYKSTANFIGTKNIATPSSNMYDSTELGYWVIDRNPANAYTVYPFQTSYLSTAGTTQWNTTVVASTKASTVIANATEIVSSTIHWPAFDGSYIDEANFSLKSLIRAATATKTTVGHFWQWKNDDETTWQRLSTDQLVVSTGFTTVSLGGRAKAVTGANKFPICVRLMFWHKTASKGAGKVSRMSNVTFRAKKTS